MKRRFQDCCQCQERYDEDDLVYIDVMEACCYNCHSVMDECRHCGSRLIGEIEDYSCDDKRCDSAQHCQCEDCEHHLIRKSHKCIGCRTPVVDTTTTMFTDICRTCEKSTCLTCFSKKKIIGSVNCLLCRNSEFKRVIDVLDNHVPRDVCNVIVEFLDTSVQQIVKIVDDNMKVNTAMMQINY